MKKIIMSLLVFATSFAMAQEEAPVAEAKAAVEVAAPAAPVSVALTGDDAELSDAYQDAVLTVNDGKHTIVTEGSAKLNEDGKVEFVNDSRFWVSNLFLMMSAVLVFIMHLGFCTLEVGFCRAKNAVNIIFKNFSIVALATLVYALVGYKIMYGGSAAYFNFPGFGLGIDAAAAGFGNGTAMSSWTDFLFQAMFAAATGSIVSGAVCERIKINAFLIFSVVFCGIVYPFVGHWGWNGAGWLFVDGFTDLAGSGLVHATGGAGALAGAIVLGPRLGKYVNGKTFAIMGHNMPVAAIGAFLLWFGWFGFNGGSQLDANPAAASSIMVMTLLASCSGVVAAMGFSWMLSGKPDLSMVLNGALAGLVGITAGAGVLNPTQSVITGAVAGILVVAAVLLLDKLKIDDPVGAIPVHLVCGSWGVIAPGLFGAANLGVQLKGIAAIVAFAFTCAFIIFTILKLTIGIRVSEEEELEGLDLGEHGMEAYSGFQIFTNQ